MHEIDDVPYVRPPLKLDKAVLPWYDAHCHLYQVAQQTDFAATVAEAQVKGIRTWLSNALNREEVLWHETNPLPGMQYSAGILPSYPEGTALTLDDLETLCKEKKIYAIGEIGLEKNFRNLDYQLKLLQSQLSLARMYDLPVVFHVTGHYDLFFKILSDLPVRGIWHGFYAAKELVRQFGAFDLTFSIGSVLTTSLRHDIVNAIIQRGNYLLETDAPYGKVKANKGDPEKQNPLIKLLVLANMISRMNGVKVESLNHDISKNIKQYLKQG